MIQIRRRLSRLVHGEMRAAELLAQIDAFPDADLDVLTGGHPALVVAPHPDDESLGCGGLIAEAAARGQRVDVVVVTDGSASHRGSRAYPPVKLAALRVRETIAAVGVLGLTPDRVHFLGLPDGAAPAGVAATRRIAARVAAIARAAEARTIFASWRYDTHPDHVAAFAYARLAARAAGAKLYAYPVWGLMLPPDARVPRAALTGHSLPIGRHLNAKRDAVFAHRSQTSNLITDADDAFQLNPGHLDKMIAGTERFIAELH